MRADRAEQHANEDAVPCVADDEQVGFFRLVDQRLCRMPVDTPALNLQRWLVTARGSDRLVQYLVPGLLDLGRYAGRCHTYQRCACGRRVVPGEHCPQPRSDGAGIASRPGQCGFRCRGTIDAYDDELGLAFSGHSSLVCACRPGGLESVVGALPSAII